MRPNLRILVAEAFTRLPAEFRHLGPPSPWASMTRPGKQMHSFLEGPVFAADGSLWVADVPYGRIFRVHQDGDWDLAFSYDGEPHSLRPMPDGRFAVVDYSKGLLALDPDNGTLEVLAADDGREPFLGLSDVTVSDQGDIWFTDSGRSSLSDPRGRLYRRRPDGKVERVLETIPYPNGLVISPDGVLLYLAVTRANAVWRLKTEGAETPPMVGIYIQLSGGLGPDGLAITADGFLALAQAQAGRAFIFDPRGDAVTEIRTPDGLSTTSVAFDRNDNLVIVEADSGSLYRVPLEQWKP
ncbi:SMP-30/gluconolactonase/LRE family protein [Pelagibius sp. CAU 1746]|uniref:SMP-30/gluconolactonase/LRE family protein n=1 Tax=Pelagibius sp. CAU 1746 TaxID=3140370 RepID=UPI00325A5758